VKIPVIERNNLNLNLPEGTGGTANNPSWQMFSIISVLGEGAYGKVYKVKCLKSSILTGEGKVLTPTMRLRKKLTKNMIGFNMGSSLYSTTFLKELLVDQFYVIKQIDTSKMPKEIALEQLMEIELLGELDSPYIVGYLDSFIEDTNINIIMEFC
jgi:serine/threonine protein kinase